MQEEQTKYSVVDLFAGVGGLSLGATRAGFSVLSCVENDRVALQYHNKNFQACAHIGESITEVSGRQILKAAQQKRICGVIGGPPCQGFSSMGKRNPSDTRNSLFLEFFRLVRELSPNFFVAENVPGILRNEYTAIRQSALDMMKSYHVTDAITLKASDYGAATSRTRVFFIGFKKKAYPKEVMQLLNFERGRKKPILVRTALQGLPKRISPDWQTEIESWRKVRLLPTTEFFNKCHNQVPQKVGDQHSINRLYNSREASGFLGTKHSPVLVERYGNLKQGEQDPISRSVRLSEVGLCPTLRAGTGSDRGSFQAVRPIHPTEPRVITVREAARLQGFPDWFQFSPTKWHGFRQIGNSVSPILGEFVLSEIHKIIQNYD